MDQQVFVFSMEGTDEHVGIFVEETDTELTLTNLFTFAKQYDQSGGLSVNMVPFVFNSCGIKKVTLFKHKIAWLASEVDKDFKQQYLASLSGLVVANGNTLNQLKKDNVVNINNFRK